MHSDSKKARDFLHNCTRKEFEQTIYDAKLTPIQDKVIRLHILEDKFISRIAMELNCSEACVSRALTAGYKHIFRVICEEYKTDSKPLAMT